MSGKSKKERKKAAKTRKREKELLREKKPKKILTEEPKLGNNAEPVPAEINEDEETAGPAPERMLEQQLEDEAKIAASEAEELAHAGKQAQSEAGALEPESYPEGYEESHAQEPEPFDPASVVANILKKKE